MTTTAGPQGPENRGAANLFRGFRRRRFAHFSLLLGSLFLGACAAPGAGRITLPDGDARAAAIQTDTAEGAISLLLASGHSRRVNSIAVDADFRYALTASDDQMALQWDIRSGKVVTRFDGHRGPVQAAVYSPDGRQVVTGGQDGTMRLWDAHSGAELRAFSIEPSLMMKIDVDVRNGIDFYGLEFMPNSRSIVAGTSNGAWVIDIDSGAQTELTPENSRQWTDIHSIDVSADGRWILASLRTGVSIWSAQTYAFDRVLQTAGGLSQSFNDNFDGNTVAAFNRDGSLVATGSEKGDVRLWNRVTESIVWERSGHGSDVTGIRFIDDSNQLLTSASDGTLRTWNLADGAATGVFEPRLGAIYASSYDAKSNTVGLANYQSAQILQFPEFNPLQYFLPLAPTTLDSSLAASPDRRYLAFAEAGGSISLLDLRRGFVVKRFNEQDDSYVSTLAFSPDSKRLMAGVGKGELLSIEVETGRVLFRTRVANEPIESIDYSPPDGRYIALAIDNRLRLLDTQGKAPSATLRPTGSLRDSIYGARFSEDGRFVIGHFLEESGILLWETGSWEPYTRVNGGPASFHSGFVTGVDYRAGARDEDRRVLSGDSSGKVALWSIRPSTLLRELRTGERVRLVAFVQDGSVGLVVTEQGIRLWDLQSGDSEDYPSGHEGKILGATLLPGERHLVTSGDDGIVRFWDIDEREPLIAHAPTFGSEWMSFSPNGLFDVPFGGLDVFQWRVQAADGSVSVVPVESFQNEFFHDGLMPDLLTGERPLPPRDILRIDRRLPSVQLSAPGIAAGSQLRQRQVGVTLRVEAAPADARWPQSAGARDARLFLNGRLVKTWPGDLLRGGQSATLQAEITLADGSNQLSAYAFNRDNVKSLDADLALPVRLDERPEPRVHLLAVGVDDYGYLDDNLTMSVADARGIAASLPGSIAAATDFEPGNIALLEDSNASRERILDTLRLWVTGQQAANDPEPEAPLYEVQPEDLLVLFFSGHGVATDADFHFLASGLDAPPSALQNLASNDPGLAAALSTGDLEVSLRDINVGQILLIFDTCYSGQVLHSEELRRGQLNTRGLAQLAFEKGVSVLTAAQSDQTARAASSLGHGYLTHALLTEGLAQGRADRAPRDDGVTLVEWFEYAAERVPALINEMQRQRLRMGSQRSALLAGGKAVTTSGTAAKPGATDFQQPRAYIPRYFYRSPETLFKPGN